jgi:hypothetical protein
MWVDRDGVLIGKKRLYGDVPLNCEESPTPSA